MKRQWITFTLSLLLITGTLSGCSLDSLFFIQSSQYSTDEEKVFENYLRNNRAGIALDNPESLLEFGLMKQDLKGKEIFLTGESHGLKSNAQLEMKFLRFFKAQTNFKYLLSEDSYSNTYYLNNYLKTGNEDLLINVFKEAEGTFCWTKDRYMFFKTLYAFNQTLTEADRIEIVGVDIEHQYRTAFKLLTELLPESDPPEALKQTLKKISNLYISTQNETNLELIKSSTEAIQQDLMQHEALFKTYLGANFDTFKYVNDNILNTVDCYSKSDDLWNSTRDAYIYSNFKKCHSKLPKGKYYGQWGLNHIYQTKEENTVWFAGHLNNPDSEFKDKILSVAYFYDNSKVMTKSNNKQYGTGNLSNVPDALKYPNRNLAGHVNLYRLISKDSPYNKVSIESYTGRTLDKPITEFFQYVVCISKDSPSEPLGNHIQ